MHDKHWPIRPFAAVALVSAVLAAAPPARAEPQSDDAVTRDRLEIATRTVAAVETVGWSVQTDLRRAREISARQRAVCLDDLLSRVHVAARAGRAMREAIVDASARGDGEGAARELVRLQHLRDRTMRLAQEAPRCGEGEAVIERLGGSGTTVRVIAPRLPDASPYPTR